jgi:hypothetical protein
MESTVVGCRLSLVISNIIYDCHCDNFFTSIVVLFWNESYM